MQPMEQGSGMVLLPSSTRPGSDPGGTVVGTHLQDFRFKVALINI